MPLFLAALQISRIDLPGFLQSNVGWKDFAGTGDRINSTLGHYNSFATFTLLFYGAEPVANANVAASLDMGSAGWRATVLPGGDQVADGARDADGILGRCTFCRVCGGRACSGRSP